MSLSILDKVDTSTAMKPPRIVIYGTPGIGKTTFASRSSNPIYVLGEDGADGVSVPKLPLCSNWHDFVEQLTALATEEHGYGTLVIDTIDAMERLLFEQICQEAGTDSINKVGGGFGQGYQIAMKRWRAVITLLDRCRANSMTIVILAHSRAETVGDPEMAVTYQRWSLKLQKDASALITEWADIIGFASRKTRVQAEDLGFAKKRGVAKSVGGDDGCGERVLRVIGNGAVVAKNRYGLAAELPLDWDALISAIVSNSK